MPYLNQYHALIASPPMWGCGLKYSGKKSAWNVWHVTPYVGVWIEMVHGFRQLVYYEGHPLCGGVD